MMKKKGIPFIVVGIVWIYFNPTLRGETSLPSDRMDCPSCITFGVQRSFDQKQASAFSLRDLEGKNLALTHLKGKPILLTFWASWCSSCKEELPSLEKFSVGKKDHLTILAIAIDGENDRKIQSFIKKNKITFPILLDVRGWIARSYGVRMVPTTFLIDGEGLMVGIVMGERDWSLPEARSVIQELFSLH